MEDDNNENCPECGCGFFLEFSDGSRICLYCPHRWNVNDESDSQQEVDE